MANRFDSFTIKVLRYIKRHNDGVSIADIKWTIPTIISVAALIVSVIAAIHKCPG